MPRTLRLHPGLITVDCSRFRKTIGKSVGLSWNIPKSNLGDLSLVCSQQTLGFTSYLHIFRLTCRHHAIESEEYIHIYWSSTFGRAPVVLLQAQSEVPL